MLTADQRAELQEIKRSSQNKMNVMWTPPLRAFVLNLVKEHRLLLGERKMEGYQRLANELDLRGEQAKSAIVGPSLSKKVRRMIQEVEGLEVPILPWHLTAKALSKQIWGFESVNETQRDMKAAAPQELDAIESDLLLHQAQPLQKQQEPPPSSNAHLFVERQGPSHTNDDDDDDDENDNKPMEYKPSTLGKRPREPIEKSSSSDVSENSDEESTASSDFEDVTPIFEVSRSSRLQRGFVPSSSAPVQTLASSRHGPVNKLSTAKKPRRDITLQSISLSDADEEVSKYVCRTGLCSTHSPVLVP